MGVAAALLCGRPAAASDAASFVARAGKAGGPYYVLVREFAAMLGAKDATVSLEVEESQGSVQNVMDAMRRGPNEFFTAPPGVVQQALRREKPFDANGSYDDIRALFPIPFQTVHWIVREDAGIKKWEDLSGKQLIAGARGSLAERQTASLLSVLGLEGQVELLDIDAAGGAEAIRDGKVAAFATAGAFPMPGIAELAQSGLQLRLLGISRDNLKQFLEAEEGTVPVVIPKGTYAGQDKDVQSVALPVGAYTTSAMSEAAAHTLTKLFWTHKVPLGRDSPHWQAITPASLATLGVKLHPGALRYYAESGVAVPDALK
jgi:uncharacterized protein